MLIKIRQPAEKLREARDARIKRGAVKHVIGTLKKKTDQFQETIEKMGKLNESEIETIRSVMVTELRNNKNYFDTIISERERLYASREAQLQSERDNFSALLDSLQAENIEIRQEVAALRELELQRQAQIVAIQKHLSVFLATAPDVTKRLEAVEEKSRVFFRHVQDARIQPSVHKIN